MNNRIGLAVLLAMSLLAAPAIASDKKASREREMLRRAQIELQQAREQTAVIEGEKNKIAQDLEQAGKSGKAAEARAARLGRELKAAQAERARLESELAAARQRQTELDARLAELDGNLKTTRATLAETEAAKKNLEGVKASNEREIASCEDRNKALYQVGRDLMTRYENKSCEDVMAEREPFTGLRRVQVENLMEQYRDKLDEQKIVNRPQK